MLSSLEVKKLVLDLGADLCGIAPAERFEKAPDGFRPADIYPACRSVIVFAKKIPEGVFLTDSFIPYSFTEDIALHEVLRLSFEISAKFEKYKIKSVPIPSEPYDYWDAESMTGKGIMSLKHAGYLAGLGIIGRNTLLNNPEYGNLIKLGAVITDASLEPDPLIENDICSDDCNMCIDNCPSGALTFEGVNQKKCRHNSEGSTKKGAPVTICNTCRRVCPNRAGWTKM